MFRSKLGKFSAMASTVAIVIVLLFSTLTPASALDTGYHSPAGQAAGPGGDGNGFEGNPANAFVDDGLFATDTLSGTSGSVSCTDPARDRQDFFNYGFSIPSGSTITGVEVRLDAKVDKQTNETPALCVQFSSDGGGTWTAAKTTPILTTTETAYLLGGAADTWGRAWAPTDFSNTNLRVRVTTIAYSNQRSFSLDWAAVKVYYTGTGSTPTHTPTTGSTNTATPTQIITSTATFTPVVTPTTTFTPGPTFTPPPVPSGLRAGLRASNYGITPFPSPTWWVNSINSMSSRFSGSVGEQVAVVVEVSGGGGRRRCWAHFPQPATGTWPNVTFDSTDLFESSFDAFDQNGIKIWLQVEPAGCDVPMLIDLLMLQYGHHPSVIGFGVDVEWYKRDIRYGNPVTDAEAQAWVAKTRTYNPGYQVFLKHWLTEKMPPTYRDGLVFIDDSQGHGSLSAMVADFSAWGQAFAPAPVGFQYGYRSDKTWWSGLADPPRDIGNVLLAQIPNTRDLIWVDFTAYDIWPPE